MNRRDIAGWKRKLQAWQDEYRDHPLLADLEAMVGHCGRLERRLQKVAGIGDSLQAELHRLNEALRISEARYRMLTDNALDVLWNFDLAGKRLSYISPSIGRLTGYAAEDVMAQSFSDTFTPASAQRMRELIGHVTLRGKLPCPSLELERRRSDGSTVWTEDVFTLLDAGQGESAQIIGVTRDISARHAAQEEQKRFFAMVSHEFRTPLATIDGAIQRLDMTAGDHVDEATRKRYAKIQNAVHRLTMLLDDYLNQDRMDAAKQGLHCTSVPPRGLLRDSEASARALSAEHAIVIDEAGMPRTIWCDPDLMRLTLRVLTDNAVKYTPAGSTIRLACRMAPDGGVELLVSDNGPGISPDELPHVFEKFFRCRASADRTGTGLGLHLAQTVVNAHGGVIDARSALGKGAEFRIWLPADERAH